MVLLTVIASTLRLGRLHVLRHWNTTWIAVESLAAHWAPGQPELACLILGYLDRHGIGHAGLRSRRARAASQVRVHPQAEQWLRAGADHEKNDLLIRILDGLESSVDTDTRRATRTRNDELVAAAHERRPLRSSATLPFGQRHAEGAPSWRAELAATSPLSGPVCAVDGVDTAGDIRGIVRCEERHERRHLFGLSVSAHWQSLGDGLLGGPKVVGRVPRLDRAHRTGFVRSGAGGR